MASSPEHRGESVRITWLLGGKRGGAKQSVTFTGPPKARLKLALAAKELVEARSHAITRAECYEAIVGSPEPAARSMPTFREWSAQYIELLLEQGHVDPHTIGKYAASLRVRTIPYLGHLRLDEIDQEAIKGWVRSMSSGRITHGNKNLRLGKGTLSSNTIRNYFIIGSSCLAAAVPQWIPANPAAVQPGRRNNQALGLPQRKPFEGMFLTPEESGLILAQCGPDLHDLVLVALRSGMRRGELVALQVRDIVFGRNGGATIMVQRGLRGDGTDGEPKTECSKRSIPVGGAAAAVLRRRATGKRPSAVVFTGPNGKRWAPSNLYDRYWMNAVAAAMRCPEHPPPAPVKPPRGPTRFLRPDEVSTCGCEGVLQRRPRFHDCRHTHASACINKNWPVKKIQRRLGHASYSTTMDIYGHLLDHGDEGELESLEEFFDLEG